MKFLILTSIIFSGLLSYAQDASMRQSISNAQSMRVRGQFSVATEKNSRVFAAQRLTRQEDDRIAIAVSSEGYIKISEAVMSSDGTIFVIGQKGQGSQASIAMLVFKGGQATKIAVKQVTPNSIIFEGGRIEIQNSRGN